LRLHRGFWILLFAVFVNRVGGMVGPFLSLYFVSNRGFTEGEAAALLGLQGVGAILGAPAGGFAADRFGRRRSLLFGLLSFSVAALLLPLGRTRAELALATVAIEFTNVFVRPATHAAIADLVPPPQRPRAYGFFRVAMNIGFAAGSLLGGWLAHRSFAPLFVVDAGTAALAAIAVMLFVAESRPARDPEAPAAPPEGRGPLGRFSFFLGCALLVNLVSTQMTSNFAISLGRRGVGEDLYGRLLALNGLWVAVAQVPVTHFSSRRRVTQGLALGALLYGIGYGLAAFSVRPLPLFLCVSVFTLGEMLFVPLGSVYVAQMAPTPLRGRYMGALQMTYGVGRALAPSLGASVLEAWGDRTLWLLSPAVGALAAFGLLLLDRRERRAPVSGGAGG